MEDNLKGPQGLKDQLSNAVKYDPNSPLGPQISDEELKKADKMKKELEDFKKKVVKKFPFIHFLSVLPANSFKFFEEDEGLVKEEIEKKPLHLIMLIPESEFKNIQKKIKPEVVKLCQETKQEIWVHIKTEVDLWNYGLDSKYEFMDAIASSFPLYDSGLLGNVRLANIHKNLVLRKFEKYVASYVIGGSIIRGTASKTSDVDTFVIIDDTDVKRMPRLQLLEKLRGMIWDYIREATALAGVTNPLNVQVYLLTDFWDSVKDANPVMFTFIRDGVPMYDRGTFLPWKLLLQMGKIKPSPEAVDKFMKYGEQNEGLVKRKMLDAMVDIYWGVVTPTQALVMLAGHAPPTPKELVSSTKKVLMDEEKVMTLKELKILEKAVKLFKDYEHGTLKEIPGKEIDLFLKESIEYDKSLKQIRKKLEDRLIEKDATKIYDEVFDLLKRSFGNKGKDVLIEEFDKELVGKGKIQKKFSAVLKDIAKAKQGVKAGKVSKLEMDNLRRDSDSLIRELIDYVQRIELVSVEKSVLQVKFGKDKKGELVLTKSGDFFVESGRVMKISSGKFKISDKKDLEKAIMETKDKLNVNLGSSVLNALEKELGEFEINL
ncbi:MAG: nucleotidyltransferase domain-containing protein [Candidatus Pacearchaeota archaeon]|nr:nucleotidyltransferase domain-containing protein [Candidatus Pacearchaeota archaeon]